MQLDEMWITVRTGVWDGLALLDSIHSSHVEKQQQYDSFYSAVQELFL